MAGKGRASNNFTMYKNSYTPPTHPGGGGWSLQQITLKALYEENDQIQNYWTMSNRGLNLCRYLGCKITCYRQPNTDYVLTYSLEPPYDTTKYYYQSLHPAKLLTYTKKIVIPSFRTQPQKKKAYKTKFIKPPKELKNQWYFQQHLAKFPLLLLAATACDLTSMYVPKNAENFNAGFYSLNTRFFMNRGFRYPHSTTGYQPSNNVYIYALENGAHPLSTELRKNVIFLGDTMLNDPGDVRGTADTYPAAKWGNVFYYRYLQQQLTTFLTNDNVTSFLSKEKVNEPIGSGQLKLDPYVYECRYNPFKDTGKGNEAYWLDVYTANTGWDPPQDPDLIVRGFPLWIMLWGWEDWIRNTKKLANMDIDYVLVIKSDFIQPKLPAYVLISDSFYNGEGPYHQDPQHIDFSNYKEWHPKWEFQKEAVENLLSVGPAVYKFENEKQTQAHIHYDFFFKWGGNPADMQNVYDPLTQPTYAIPDNQLITNEKDDPETDIANYIYHWDVRRDFLTQTASERIKKDSIYGYSVFTDGDKTATTAIPFQRIQETPQEKTSPEKTQEAIFLQLQQCQQHNQQLQQRFRKLKQMLDNA